MQFIPCKGGDFCTHDGTHCKGCGRSHQEIAETRELIAAVAKYALGMGYGNIEEFTLFVATRAAGLARQEQAAGNS
jgi:hypothetical protein